MPSTIWRTSSRVGASTRALGRGSSASIRSTMGTAKASVLPDPVGDLTSTSRPASTSGTTRRWTGKGSWMPPSERASTTALDAPRPAKACVDICDSFAGDRRWPPDDSGDSTDPDRRSARDKNLAGEGAPAAARLAVEAGGPLPRCLQEAPGHRGRALTLQRHRRVHLAHRPGGQPPADAVQHPGDTRIAPDE